MAYLASQIRNFTQNIDLYTFPIVHAVRAQFSYLNCLHTAETIQTPYLPFLILGMLTLRTRRQGITIVIQYHNLPAFLTDTLPFPGFSPVFNMV